CYRRNRRVRYLTRGVFYWSDFKVRRSVFIGHPNDDDGTYVDYVPLEPITMINESKCVFTWKKRIHVYRLTVLWTRVGLYYDVTNIPKSNRKASTSNGRLFFYPKSKRRCNANHTH